MTLTYSPPVGTPVWLDEWDANRTVRAAVVTREVEPDERPADVKFPAAVRQFGASGDVIVEASRLTHRHVPVDELATIRQLQLLGVPPEVIGPLIDYVNALNRCAVDRANEEGYGFHRYYGIDPQQTGAAKYLQVIDADTPDLVAARSVHAVVIKTTGEVCKPGGWRKGPAKSTSKARKGQPLVAYTLTDPVSFAAMVARLDPHGGYLYSK